jgi:uncharacterized protein
VVTLETLRERRGDILEMASRHGASNVRVFGSVARGDTNEDSDIDVLIDLEEGRSLFDLIAVKQDLEDLFGCKVDVGTARSLRPRLKDRVLREALPL